MPHDSHVHVVHYSQQVAVYVDGKLHSYAQGPLTARDLVKLLNLNYTTDLVQTEYNPDWHPPDHLSEHMTAQRQARLKMYHEDREAILHDLRELDNKIAAEQSDAKKPHDT